MKRTEENKTEVAPFTLDIPAQFDVKPDFEVDMPGGRKALIYSCTHEHEVGGTVREVKGWRIVVVNRKGVMARLPNAYGNLYRAQNDYRTNEPLNVKLYLDEMASMLSRTKRSRTETTEYDDE